MIHRLQFGDILQAKSGKKKQGVGTVKQRFLPNIGMPTKIHRPPLGLVLAH